MSARITVVDLEGLASYLTERPEVARKAARLAINDTASRKAVPTFRKSMQDQVAFPPGYLKDDRFGLTKEAIEADLTAVITARFRPTSLARFAKGSKTKEGARRAGGVRVGVKRGGARFMKGAFFVNLNRGKDTSDGFNLGLAIRLKPGQTLRGRRKGASGVQLAPDLYLLYGPSVDQVFRDVSTADGPKVADQLEREFVRQWVRLNSSTI